MPLRRWRERLAHGDYSRCEPYCTDNPKPSRLALAYKYGYLLAAQAALLRRQAA